MPRRRNASYDKRKEHARRSARACSGSSSNCSGTYFFAFLAGAFFAGSAFLAGAFFAGAAFLAPAFLAGAFLAGAALQHAFFAHGFLAGAFFAGAAFLAGAFFAVAISVLSSLFVDLRRTEHRRTNRSSARMIQKISCVANRKSEHPKKNFCVPFFPLVERHGATWYNPRR